uniref:Suppressor of forked domain-containing protein n=1 Tax=Amorphochlora amoebiformis TaxID=1561963 RepID=A0A7S0DS41_9EUKA
MYSAFEKKHGTRETVEDVILSKRRFQYEEEIKENPLNYDVWFDYIRLEESKGIKERVREVYERAIANRPPVQEKRFYKRYIFLWINYAIYEELEVKNSERARQVWRACLDIIPHKKFTFAKVWIMAAHFEVRQKDLSAARKLLGVALGKCPKEKLFKSYIELELQLVEMDRCRKIYEKYLEFLPENCKAWVQYAELEGSLQEDERARAIFEMAVNQPTLDMPEMLWKAYIDFEIKCKAHKRVRALYDRLFKRTKHVRVWISRAQFEASLDDVKAARKVFEDADAYFKSNEEAGKEERVMLVESWLDFETNYGSNKSVKIVRDKLPRRVKNKRLVKGEDGSDAYWEEYYDYIFPDEDKKQNTFKLLEMARAWKKQKSTD